MKFSTHFIVKVSLSICLISMGGCTTTDTYKIEKSSLVKADASDSKSDISTEQLIEQTQIENLNSMPGAGVVLSNVKNDVVPNFDNKKVFVKANRLPIPEFINLVYGEQLEVDYVLGENVQNSNKRVTLNLEQEIAKGRLFTLSKNLLEQKQIYFEVKDNVFFFYQQKGNAKKAFSLGVGRDVADIPNVAGEILHILPLYYADWRSLSRITTNLTSAKLSYVKERNSILITGSKDEVTQVIRIINAFDRPSAKGRHIGIIDLVYISPEEFKLRLEEIFAVEGVRIVKSAADEGTVAVTPMSRQRSVLVHSLSQEIYDRVVYWAERLDIPSSSDGKRYFTYYPQNVSANDMGASLSQLFKLSGEATSSVGSRSKPSSNNKANNSGSQSQGTPGGGAIQTKDLSMAIDEVQNALVFYATPSKYHETIELIKQLDVMPGQVLIEAAVAEVTLEGSFSQGIDWSLSSENVRDTSSSVLDIKDGLSYVLSGLDYTATIKFLQSNSKVNIVSRPRLLVRDGRSASMNVGTEVPVITQTVNELENTGQILQTVQYRTTGVSLQVTPTINAKGVVSLQLSQQVSEAGENKSSSIDSPIILNRTFQTELLALNGKTVVLGGLISENNSNGSAGVPLLQDVPILGNLFKSKNKRNSRVELVVMITPRIISNQQDIDEAIEIFSNDYQNMLLPSRLNELDEKQ